MRTFTIFQKFLFLIFIVNTNNLFAACSGSNTGSWNTTSSSTYSKNDEYVRSNATDYYEITLSESGLIELSIKDDDSGNWDNLTAILYSDSNCNTSIWSASTTSKQSTETLTFNNQLIAGSYVLRVIGSDDDDNTKYDISGSFTSNTITYTETADDICYDDYQLSGMMCTSFGGMFCTTTFPIRNISNENLSNVQIVHNEDGMTGSFASGCSVSPSGTCSEEEDFDMGPFGMFGNAVTFDFASAITPTQTTASISTTSMMSMNFFTTTSLYATYQKDGVYYRGAMSKCPEVSSGGRDFEIRNPPETRNIKGNLKVIGNTVLCYKNNGVCRDTDSANNQVSLSYIDVDNTNNTYNNSSQAQVANVPSSAKIVWAGFYTQGYLKTTSSATLNALNSSPNYLTTPTGSTISLMPDVIDLYPYRTDEFTYATFTEVEELKGLLGSDVNGWFTGANIKAREGDDSGALGYFAAWTLVLVYEDESESLKNISVFDGYKQIGDSNNQINLSGFLTPTSGDVKSTVSIFVGEGDKNIVGDDILIDDTSLSSSSTKNAFNSTVNGFSTNPNPVNYQGIDIHNYDVGVDGDLSHPQLIGNGRTSTKIDLTTTGDYYYPSMVAFTTELYEPRVCYYIDSIKDQNGNAIFEDTGDGAGPRFTGEINDGEEYTYNIWISNMAQDPTDTNLETALLVQVYMEMNHFDYESGTILMNNIGGASSYESMSDGFADDLAEYNSSKKTATFRVGVGANSIEGGTLVPTIFSNNSQKAYVQFNGALDIQGDATEIDLLDYLDFKASFKTGIVTISPENAQTISQCKDLDSSATVGIAPAGVFNVIMSSEVSNMAAFGSDPMPDTASPLNAIPTQVSNKSFEIAVVSLDKDGSNNPTVLSQFKGIVAVELIDQPDYSVLLSDTEKSLACANAPTLSSAPTYFNFPVNGGGSIFSIGMYIYEKAFRDAAFRVKYLTNGINAEAVDWNCADNTYNCLWGMLVSTFGNNANTPCRLPCEPGGGTGNNQASAACVECIFGGAYAGSVCSRDNFAIRPEKFTLSTPAFLRAGKDYNISLVAQQYNSTLQTLDYNVSDVQASFTPLQETQTIYNPDGSDATATLDGNLSFVNTSFSINNGISNSVGLSFDDVGLVQIKLVDENWSAVDISKGQTPADCSETGGYVCGEVNATFIPDHFTLSSVSLKNAGNQTFTYFSNDLNHSAKIITTLTAEKFGGGTTLNFKDGAWENNVSLTFTAPQVYGLDANRSEIILADLNFTSGTTTIFSNDTNSSKMLMFNYPREVNTTRNPVDVNGSDFTVNALSTYTNGGTTENVTGSSIADANATFIYGRTHAPRQRFTDVGTPTDKDVLIYYEAYCYGTDCNKTLLPNGINSVITDDPRWWVNTLHTNPANGIATDVAEKNAANTITVTTVPSGVHQDRVLLNYDGSKGYPYVTTMENNASSWLIFNQFNPNATHNEFVLEFYKDGGDYVGSGKSSNSVNIQQNGTLDVNENRSWW